MDVFDYLLHVINSYILDNVIHVSKINSILAASSTFKNLYNNMLKEYEGIQNDYHIFENLIAISDEYNIIISDVLSAYEDRMTSRKNK